jgi:carboxypeptidase family protein
MMPIITRTIGRIIPALICVVLFSAAVSQAQKAAPEKMAAAPAVGTITGRIVMQGGEAINAATVFATSVGVIAQPRSAAVDNNGNFKLDGLEPGVYSVSAFLPGFIPPATPAEEPRRYYHTGDSITLTLIRGGVITGTVTNSTNGPVVAAPMRAFRIKDVSGQPEPAQVQPRERVTDDRGVYRFYGLPPGTYVISAGGQGRQYGGVYSGTYDNDVPTYALSSTRDTAMQVVVQSGEEIVADIQYRGEPGQVISGTLTGLTQSISQPMGIATGTVTLTDVRSHSVLMSVGSSSVNNNSFAFYGVADGEYEILAQQYLPSREMLVSAPRRVRVQGANLTGINLNLAPLANITGQVVIEINPPADCVKRRATALLETVVSARRFTPEAKPGTTAKSESVNEVPLAAASQGADGVPDAKGDFVMRNLHRGSYRIDSQLPDAGWYLRSITMLPATGTRAPEINIPRDGINLKTGERSSGLTVTITEGAAGLRGRVSVAEGQSLPSGLRVYLAPAERESREDVLRFFEGRADADGSFVIGNIAPGRYWIIARPDPVNDPAKVKSIRRDPELRAKVLREAEGLKKDVSFKPCERTIDYDLRYLLTAPPPKP